MRAALERMVARLLEVESFDYKICVDTAPLLERSFARQAGLGWIGRNTCLINEPLGIVVLSRRDRDVTGT